MPPRATMPAEAASPLPGEAVATPAELSPLAHLVAGHLIPDGEIILLLLKPSLWFVPLTSLLTLGISGLIALTGMLFGGTTRVPIHTSSCINFAILLAAARLMTATLQWMGRYYILTDMRVMTLSGVFQTQVFQCPLRRVARVRVLRTLKDRLLNVGQVEIIPQEEEYPIGSWQSVSSPRKVKDRLTTAIARAKSTGRGS